MAEQRKPRRMCGEKSGPSHPCAEPADDGHTMHRCAFERASRDGHSCCEWGHL